MKQAPASQPWCAITRGELGFLVETICLRRIERAPEIPGSDRAIRPPFFAKLEKLFLGREFSAAKGFRETFLNPVVRDRPDIEPAEFEKEQHFHRPPSYSAHCRQAFVDLFIVHACEGATGRHRPIKRLGSQVF